MSETVWIQGRYESAYGLLGAMARELHDAFVATGHDARLVDMATDAHPREGVFVFFNAPVSLDAFPAALWERDSGLRGVQVFVDHPFALPEDKIDEWRRRNGLENFRMCLPCADDVHLLRLRWPGLKHAWVGHGVARSCLCEADGVTRAGWDGRAFDVVVTGSIAEEAYIARGFDRLTPAVAGMVREVVAMMVADPRVGYLQAVDLVMGSRGVITGEWKTAQLFWRLCVMMVNRTRRVRAVQSLQGLRVGVFGSAAWREFCTGTVSYGGEVAYGEIASAFGRGRVGLAWGPTQFVHSYSERIMLAMSAGCAAVSDDRLLVRRDFGGACGLYNAGDPSTARAVCDRVLASPDQAVEMARRGRALVEERCLWEHRVPALLERAGAVAAAA